MQAKDIPEQPILDFLDGPYDGWPVKGWATWFWDEKHPENYPNSVLHAMPHGTPVKVALAKMRAMIKKKLITGCCCGCRGDFQLIKHP